MIIERPKNSRVTIPIQEDVTQQEFVAQVLEEKGIEASPCGAKNLETAIKAPKGQVNDNKV